MPRVGSAEWNRQRNMINDNVVQATDPSPPVMVVAEPQEDIIKDMKKKIRELENQMGKKDKIIYKQNTQIKEKEFLIQQFKNKINTMQNGLIHTRIYDTIGKEVIGFDLKYNDLNKHVNKISYQHREMAIENELLEDKITDLQYKNMRHLAKSQDLIKKQFTEKSLLQFQEVEIGDLIEQLANTVAVLSKMITMCQKHLGTYFKINETEIFMKIDKVELKEKNNLNNDTPTVHIENILPNGDKIDIDAPIELDFSK